MSPTLLWTPSAHDIRESNLSKFTQWLKNQGHSFDNYGELWKWSVNSPDEFWLSLWHYFDIEYDGDIHEVISRDPMPFTRWFDGTSISYAEHVFRNYSDTRPAIISGDESGRVTTTSWKDLKQQVAAVRSTLLKNGIKKGDTVVAYLPSITEATVGFLAANSIGAIWSSCSPDFGSQSVLDRFSQISPKALIATTTYHYNGKTHDKSSIVSEIIQALPDLQCILLLGDDTDHFKATKTAIRWRDVIQNNTSELGFTRVPFQHPMWILFSSGTTGLPKAITHSQGGILLEQLKYGTFHNDYKPGERCFWYTTTGWMMWNYIQGSLLCGATMLLYDGSPAFPDLGVLWRFAEKTKMTHFGTSAGFILANLKEKIVPRDIADLTTLRSLGSTGSTLPPEGFTWIYDAVKKDLWLTSMSGGTDVCSAFVGGNPTLPVYAGEIQCRALGCSLEAWDEEGKPLVEDEGEMVITKPMPSMPVFFWNDPEFQRYKESYFEMYPGIWRHGDWIRVTSRDGVVIYGRSDATLNRGGIRIGTSEVYRAVDQVKEVKDSLIVCIEKEGGEFWMPLFVLMQEGNELTDETRRAINAAIRNAYSRSGHPLHHQRKENGNAGKENPDGKRS